MFAVYSRALQAEDFKILRTYPDAPFWRRPSRTVSFVAAAPVVTPAEIVAATDITRLPVDDFREPVPVGV
jgi:hypothetical protein